MSAFYYDLYVSSRLFGVAHERIEKESPLTPEDVSAFARRSVPAGNIRGCCAHCRLLSGESLYFFPLGYTNRPEWGTDAPEVLEVFCHPVNEPAEV
ncbi:MAG: hypothetical protein I3J00_06665 [Mesosutterella multiformis]|nr:hypothetical protein [Mesosutterella multiformis]